MLDDIDQQVLTLLERDDRIPREQIATMLGIPLEELASRIERLEQERIILRYQAFVNWTKADPDLVSALIEVRVAPQRDVGFDSIARRIARFPEARSVYLVSGTYDIAVEVVGRTLRDVASFVSEKLAPLEGVHGTTTHFLLKRYKEDGLQLEEQEEATRLPLTP